MQVRDITVADLWKDGEHLFPGHADVVGMRVLCTPDRQLHQQMEDNGDLIALGAYHEGEMAGYALAVLQQHPHTGVEHAAVIAIYVGPDVPGAGNALMLQLASAAKKAGAVSLLWSAKHGSKFAKVLAGQHRMRKSEVIYEETL
jgi:hypothetical protein